MPDPGRPARLRVEHLADALGIGVRRPRFSWWLPNGAVRQFGYRIRFEPGWDSGRVSSSDNVLVEYGGPELRSGERVAWQVKVWTDLGESDWSHSEVFELGLLSADDWSAQWVAPLEPAELPAGARPAMLLRGEFDLPETAVVRARMYATAHGIYEVFVNGARVGDAELTPGYTEYRDRLQVQTYDVTGLLVPGRNAVGAIVSDGWFRGQVGLPRAHDQWGSELGFLAQVCATFGGGATAVAGTGSAWRSMRSWIEAADLIAGETVDLRRVIGGWSEPGFDDSGWDQVAVADYGYENLVASPAPPVRALEELSPISVRRVARGQVFDLGQNINGWVRPVWERWNGIDADGKPYESLNHYSKGAVISFLHRYVAGIRLLDSRGPAYRHFRIEPRPGGGITWARAEHDSPNGRIESSWRLAAGAFELAVTVPPGTTAEIVLPDASNRTVEPGRHGLVCLAVH